MSGESQSKELAVAEFREECRRYSSGLLRRLLRRLPTRQATVDVSAEVFERLSGAKDKEIGADPHGYVLTLATYVLWGFYVRQGLGQFPLEQSFEAVGDSKPAAAQGSTELRTLAVEFNSTVGTRGSPTLVDFNESRRRSLWGDTSDRELSSERAIAEAAAAWLQSPTSRSGDKRAEFLAWLRASSNHVLMLLEMTATADELESVRGTMGGLSTQSKKRQH